MYFQNAFNIQHFVIVGCETSCPTVRRCDCCRILNLPTNTQSHYVNSALLRYHRPILSISLPLIPLISLPSLHFVSIPLSQLPDSWSGFRIIFRCHSLAVQILKLLEDVFYLIGTGCLEKKFTQEILNKIRSFWCTRLIFTRAHRKVGRSVWWRFHSNRLTLLGLAELWKNMLKLHIFVRLSIATENSSHAFSPLQKKIECTCFKFVVSIVIRICNLAWTVV